MKRICITALFVWSLLWVAGGCTQTEVEEKDIPLRALKNIEAVFNLNVLANRVSQTRSIMFTTEGTVETDSVAVGIRNKAVTKAAAPLGELEESRIAQLWIGQYDADGKQIFSQNFPSMTETRVDVKLKDSQSTTHHIWFVANSGDLSGLTTEKALEDHLLTYTSTVAGLPDNNLCGMSGMWSGVIEENGVENISVEMIRMVAKISFTYLIEESKFSFTPSAVTLSSVPGKLQIKEPDGQLMETDYKTYTETGSISATGETMYWYLPENKAGNVTGENAALSEKGKTGKGVTDATYIELKGKAVQGGVTYEDVCFRFYPGSGDMNDYNIKRNHHYTMNVTLKGIDISDERITVGTIPSIDTEGLAAIPAGTGGTTELQITARPGQPWAFRLPEWLSAVINNNQTVDVSNSVNYQGPAKVLFKAEKTNPKAENRTFSFPINVTGKEEEQTINIVQLGSTITVGNKISLEASSGSESKSSFTATKGLAWGVVLSDVDWLEWPSDFIAGGDEATGEPQELVVKATSSNPYKNERQGSITVKGGESVGTGYDGLKKEITVTQAGSTISGSTQTVAAEAASNLTSSFMATPGLNWAASVTEGSWIALATTSGGPTTNMAENITYSVTVNPNAFQRSEEITIHAGDKTSGPIGKITVTQEASVFSVSTPAAIPAAGGEVTSQVTATDGLAWTVSQDVVSEDITVDTNNGSGNGTLTFTASANSGNARTGTFLVAVDANSERKFSITVTQGTGEVGAIIGDLEVQMKDQGWMNLNSAVTSCKNLGDGWRVPSKNELLTIYAAKAELLAVEGFKGFGYSYYWSSSNEWASNYWIVYMLDGHSGTVLMSQPAGIRCVRTKAAN